MYVSVSFGDGWMDGWRIFSNEYLAVLVFNLRLPNFEKLLFLDFGLLNPTTDKRFESVPNDL